MGLFQMDDTSPLQDYSGYNRTATITGSPVSHLPLMKGATYAPVFTNTVTAAYASPVFKQGYEEDSFTLGVWVRPIPPYSEQQVLGNPSNMDGITINGLTVNFVVKYATAPESRCSFTLQSAKAVSVFAVHTQEKNSLYVDGSLVAEVDITEAQQADTFATTGSNLVTGANAGTQKVAVNGVSIFSKALDAETIFRLHTTGRAVPSGEDVVENYVGDFIPVSMGYAEPHVVEVYDTDEDWNTGVMTDVSVSENLLVPQFEDGISVEGWWYTSLQLDISGDTTIYGVSLNYDGQGVTVETSIDGTTWVTAAKGGNVSNVPPGFTTIDKLLEVRVHFPGGIADDPAYLKSLTLGLVPTGTTTATIGRTVTYNNASPRGSYPPIEMNDDWGVDIPAGGSVVIGADTLEASPARTIGVWIKRTGANPTLSATGTNYQNGAAGTATFVADQWTLYHVVASADITGSITINGPAKVGAIEIYETALTAGDISNIYAAYFGNNQVKVTDTSTITVSEPATAASIYAADWSITAAG